MSSIPKSTKKQDQENSLRRKLLREYTTSQSEDHDLIHLYINLKKHLLSQAITNVEILDKE